ncbi:hypothetical protein PYCCODRAFT_683469 [Trametes coccinea BRFM310]|uniref:Uncharacterized protein n=1 Tax=Trametes coccinea (strain BRFM310) TaxID=1353009 RepID=A0A1Y2IH77_TRAC3|nr:hypothetical protein PYCCODRAFT_683469 [Trametes coccinea BRFM310]
MNTMSIQWSLCNRETCASVRATRALVARGILNGREHEARATGNAPLAREGSYALASFNTPPQAEARPRAVAKCLALTEGSAFVRVSATIESVGQ